jgi:hypothetical protein
VRPTDQFEEQATRTTIDNFNDAFNRHNVEALAALLTDDTVFETTSPAPEGGESKEKPQCWSSGADGSRRMPTLGSVPKK